MYSLIRDIIGIESASSDIDTIVCLGSVVLIIVFCVATVDLISRFVSVFTRIK